MPRIGAAHRHRDREAGRHQLWSPLRWPASTRLPSCAAAAHRPGPHGRRPSPAPRSFDGGLVSLGPIPPRHPHRPITIARVLVPRLRSIRLLSRPGPTGWPMLRTACAGPHRTLIHSAALRRHSGSCRGLYRPGRDQRRNRARLGRLQGDAAAAHGRPASPGRADAIVHAADGRACREHQDDRGWRGPGRFRDHGCRPAGVERDGGLNRWQAVSRHARDVPDV